MSEQLLRLVGDGNFDKRLQLPRVVRLRRRDGVVAILLLGTLLVIAGL
jgi:hypothetical protein